MIDMRYSDQFATDLRTHATIFTRMLHERIIYLTGPINDIVANAVITQMLFLESENPNADISLYINSEGGEVASGLAIYDTMQYIKPDVSTICVGLAASMASILLMAGTKGKRYILPHSEVMIHQPLGGCAGQASDIAIHAQNILRIRDEMYDIIAMHTKMEREKIITDTDRDTFLTAHQALAYGIIDKIITKRST